MSSRPAHHSCDELRVIRQLRRLGADDTSSPRHQFRRALRDDLVAEAAARVPSQRTDPTPHAC